ncbi:hypothetical protein [Schaalia cardiffensis]|uniref:hypothetical protein n=1 Tax=Schaalia cardiffensis TaxID=181487 RepID=UPI0023F1FA0B|nr:hypothetical protein [Schaalia cardiffensis]
MDSLSELRIVCDGIRARDNLVKERNRLIAQARRDRFTWNEIVEVTGLTRQAARNAEQLGKKLEAE